MEISGRSKRTGIRTGKGGSLRKDAREEAISLDLREDHGETAQSEKEAEVGITGASGRMVQGGRMTRCRRTMGKNPESFVDIRISQG